MIRKLILPALAMLLLAGCMTGYTYRTAPGDYYYGQPSTIYRDYYGYPYYYGSPYSLRGYYRYGYGYPYYYGGRYPWYGHGHHHSPRPGNDGNDTPDRKTPPWRDLDRIGHEARPDVPRRNELRMRPLPQAQRQAPARRTPAPVQRPIARPSAERRGSAMSEMIRRAQSNGDSGRNIEE